ncbi:hypothetical protein D6C78_02932 [Aureobasidium pullulans]|uniref:F-box domain-containing protein n=1 Tax=Aureobasidium pullulans TaxID=5580 RepID=A0A4T0C539_AURPU|nr:hypothetical protein D6C78_02932 [Aureobasidium pullulans]
MAETADSALFRLMDLPNELIKLVCSHADLSVYDLMALRRTCKLTFECSSDEFARRCFHSITVLMARSSLLAFIELSQHPRFGPFIQWINISPTIASEEGLGFLPSATAPHIHDIPVPPVIQGFTAFVLDVQCMDIMRTYLNRLREENELKTDGSAEQMLNIAFKALAERKQNIRLSFSDQETNAVGAKHLLPNLHFGERTVWHLEWEETIARTIRAASKQGCTIDKIELCETARQDARNISACCTDGIEQELTSLCFQLDALDIEVNHQATETTVRSAKRMVSAAPSLGSLYLSRIVDYNNANQVHIPGILKCVASKSLRTIHLGNFQISTSDLASFLARHRHLLYDLQLSCVCLVDGDCMSLIGWIKDNLPRLKELCLEGICDHVEDTPCQKYSSCMIGVNGDVQTELAKILKDGFPKRVKEIQDQVDGQVETQVDGQAETQANEEIEDQSMVIDGTEGHQTNSGE